MHRESAELDAEAASLDAEINKIDEDVSAIDELRTDIAKIKLQTAKREAILNSEDLDEVKAAKLIRRLAKEEEREARDKKEMEAQQREEKAALAKAKRQAAAKAKAMDAAKKREQEEADRRAAEAAEAAEKKRRVDESKSATKRSKQVSLRNTAGSSDCGHGPRELILALFRWSVRPATQSGAATASLSAASSSSARPAARPFSLSQLYDTESTPSPTLQVPRPPAPRHPALRLSDPACEDVADMYPTKKERKARLQKFDEELGKMRARIQKFTQEGKAEQADAIKVQENTHIRRRRSNVRSNQTLIVCAMCALC